MCLLSFCCEGCRRGIQNPLVILQVACFSILCPDHMKFSLGGCLSFQHFLQAPFSANECPHLSSQGQRQALRILVLLRLRWGQGPAEPAKPAGRSDDAHCCWDVGSKWWPAGRHGRLRWVLADLEPGWSEKWLILTWFCSLNSFSGKASSMDHCPWNTRSFPRSFLALLWSDLFPKDHAST